ncbi:hypothetical protein CEXT_71801 [Caerostris extrusa]|uniref:Uncharacterized protein n=1 Tax=Caerostris extrusa TaxID=172846 RepID=A0AAV4NIH5_CAEEX|nr:hypothetical protein CEXT_71801 [Caerostris extrusa]
MMKLLLIIGLSFVIDGVLAKRCDYSEFQECDSQVQDFADFYTFHVTSAAVLKDSGGSTIFWRYSLPLDSLTRNYLDDTNSPNDSESP